MLKKILTTSLILTIHFSAFSQIDTDTISFIKVFGGHQFIYKNQILNPINIKKITEDCPEAKKYGRKANTNFWTYYSLSYIGGAVIGWPIGTAIGGGNPDWNLALAGGGFILISIPFAVKANNYYLLSAKLFNYYVQKQQ